VASREPKKAKSLEGSVLFEPSRVAEACLAQAYERVAPIIRRTRPSVQAPTQADRELIKQPRGGGQS
jgi:hypothetical protein